MDVDLKYWEILDGVYGVNQQGEESVACYAKNTKLENQWMAMLTVRDDAVTRIAEIKEFSTEEEARSQMDVYALDLDGEG